MERTTGEHTFFFRPESPFSQWHPARFVVDGITFGCAEVFAGQAASGSSAGSHCDTSSRKVRGRVVSGPRIDIG